MHKRRLTIKNAFCTYSNAQNFLPIKHCHEEEWHEVDSKNGVGKRIPETKPRVLHTNCYGHPLSLASSNVIKKSSLMSNALSTAHYKIYQVFTKMKISVEDHKMSSAQDHLESMWSAILNGQWKQMPCWASVRIMKLKLCFCWEDRLRSTKDLMYKW